MSFEKSNRQILEIKSAISEIKGTNFENKKCHLRNQRDKYWKSKVSFEKSNGKILEIKSVISEIKREKFKMKNDNRNQNDFSF